MDDKSVVSRCLTGDEDAFEMVVNKYQFQLLHFAWRILGDKDDAKDITQDTFVRSYYNLQNYDPNKSFKTWLFTIAYRLCLNHLRKHKAVSGEMDFARVGQAGADASVELADSEEARRLRELIWTAVEKLSPEEALEYITAGKYRVPEGAGMSPYKTQPFFNPYTLVKSVDQEDLQRRNFHQLFRVAKAYKVNIAAIPPEALKSRLLDLM